MESLTAVQWAPAVRRVRAPGRSAKPGEHDDSVAADVSNSLAFDTHISK